MTELLYSLPIEVLVGFVAVIFVGVYWIGCIVLRPIVRLLVRSRVRDNEIVGSLLEVFGVLYGLLMSLIAVAAYQNVNLVESQAGGEASAILALHRDVSEYPSPLRGQLQAQVREYCAFIIKEEWPLLRQGIHPKAAHGRLRPIFQGLLALEHKSQRDEVIQLKALEHYEIMAEHGRHRRYASAAAIPEVMWYVVILGTIINFALMWSFDMRFVTQLFLGGLVAFFLGVLILLIAVLDRPYRSLEFGVPPEAFELVHEVMLQEEALGASVTRPEEL